MASGSSLGAYCEESFEGLDESKFYHSDCVITHMGAIQYLRLDDLLSRKMDD